MDDVRDDWDQAEGEGAKIEPRSAAPDVKRDKGAIAMQATL